MLSRTQWSADYPLMGGMQRGLADCSSLRDSADFLVACCIKEICERVVQRTVEPAPATFTGGNLCPGGLRTISETTVVNKTITVIAHAQEGLLSEMDVTPITKAFDRVKVHLPLVMV
jgi:hypothetical protein